MSKKCEAEKEQIARKYGLDELGVNPIKDIDKIGKSLHEPRPARDELNGYLESLSKSEVEKLQTLMYAWGNEDAIHELHRDLKNNTLDRDDAIQTMMGKGSRHLDLAEGLKVAASQSVDLDEPF